MGVCLSTRSNADSITTLIAQRRAAIQKSLGEEQQKAGIVCERWFKEAVKDDAIESITQLIRTFHGSDREFVYENDYDGNGVVYWVGTKYGTEKKWKNPSKRGLIRVDSSGWGTDNIDAMVAKEACREFSENIVGAWASIEFVDGVTVRPTKYTLSHETASHYLCLRSWVFEGSNDGAKWTAIREHSNDKSLWRKGQSHSWDTPNADGYFNRFRVRMTGGNSEGSWQLCAHALEIYGFVRGDK